mgnify:CR=1 FL=1
MAETMRGLVFLGDRRAEVRELPKPGPGPGEVLVRLRCAAVCGSDLHVYRQPVSYFAGKTCYEESSDASQHAGLTT